MAAATMSTRTVVSVCCDATIVVRLVTEPTAVAVQNLWSEWNRRHVSVVAPMLFRFELTNAVHRIARQKTMNDSDASLVLEAMFRLPVRCLERSDLHANALAISRRFNLSAAYDAHYLALSQILAIPFFNAGERLYNSVRQQFSWVNFVT